MPMDFDGSDGTVIVPSTQCMYYDIIKSDII